MNPVHHIPTHAVLFRAELAEHDRAAATALTEALTAAGLECSGAEVFPVASGDGVEVLLAVRLPTEAFAERIEEFVLSFDPSHKKDPETGTAWPRVVDVPKVTGDPECDRYLACAALRLNSIVDSIVDSLVEEVMEILDSSVFPSWQLDWDALYEGSELMDPLQSCHETLEAEGIAPRD